MDYQKVEETIIGIIAEVYKCLERLNRVRGMDLTSDPPSSTSSRFPDDGAAPPPPAPVPAPIGLHGADPLFGNPQSASALSRETTLRRERGRAVSFFRKVSFAWSLSDDVSDRAKI